MAGEVPTPLLSEYSAAKSYVSSFSKALNAEYKGKGVHIQCQGTYSRTHFLTFLLTYSLTHSSIICCYKYVKNKKNKFICPWSWNIREGSC